MNASGTSEGFANQKQQALLLVLFFAGSVVLQVLMFQFLPAPRERNRNGDYFGYYEPVALNLLAGKGLVEDDGRAATRYPPGFPLLLTGIFSVADGMRIQRLQLVGVFNILVSSFDCILVFFIAKFIFTVRVAAISALLWMTYPLQMWLSVQPNSEIPYLPMFLLSVLVALHALGRRQPALGLAAGCLLGFAALFRPAALISTVVMAGALLVLAPRAAKWRGLLASALLLFGFLLFVIPWESYARSKASGEVALVAKGTSNVLDGLTFALPAAQHGEHTPLPEDVWKLMLRIDAQRPQLSSPGKVLSYMFDEFRENPVAVMKLILLKIVRAWFGTYNMHYDYEILIVQLVYLGAFGIGLWRALRQYRDRLPYILFLILVVGSAWASCVLVMPIVRYLVPVMSLVLIIAAVGFDSALFSPRSAPEVVAEA
ncbi:MAG TPA: glycosyltransferase family 39 protein [Candidatus Acidoferrum sp.]|nr:glycosyltransferase family 39 protein [Candidatus Acidoferrum sp.]